MSKRTEIPEVLMISKPIVPPWNDSAKNIVRSQVTRGSRFRYRVLTIKAADNGEISGVPADLPEQVRTAPVYTARGKFSPSITQNLRVLAHALRPRGASIYHYFFAPNPVTSTAGRALRILSGVKTVQTVCSKPLSFDNISRLLFSDRVIVLSEDTQRRMIAAGVDESKVRLVRPCIEPIEQPDEAQKRAIRRENGLPVSGPLIIFPGDYRFSKAAQTVAEAVPLLVREDPDLTVVFACRIKGPGCLEERERVRREMERAGVIDHVRFLEAPTSMPQVIGTADTVLMPAESLYAKMDAPLVLLEAMSQAVPLILADVSPLNELLACGAGIGIPPADPVALAQATHRLLVNRSMREELGRAGSRAIRDIFSAKTMTESVEAIYDEVLAK